MAAVIQEEATGCGIASVANVLGKTYSEMKAVANAMGIYAEDKSLWSETQYVREMLSSAGVETSPNETPFESWSALLGCRNRYPCCKTIFPRFWKQAIFSHAKARRKDKQEMASSMVDAATSMTSRCKLWEVFHLQFSMQNGVFRHPSALPDLALLSIKHHQEDGKNFWHWVVFKRAGGKEFVLDSSSYLPSNIRTDFNEMQLNWFIEVKNA